jgi:methylenetetrahydrofolate dehydrogenase (NADP+) / methenyltetrahydrofolate cyclohydrolase
MSAEMLNGKTIAAEINSAVREKIAGLKARVGKGPKLVSLTIGEGEDARIYVNMQKKAAELVGIEFERRELACDTTSGHVEEVIEALNADSSITAVIVQKPVPEDMDHDNVVDLIDPWKDAEGIHPYNMGRILRREADILPCTPGAVMKMLRLKGVGLYGKEVVIIGHSAIVGKPLSLMMVNEMATTTVCHLGTSEKGDIAGHARRADILVVAVGKAGMVKGDWIKPGAVVIDVGINRVKGRIVGDVDLEEAAKRAAFITPVPGGVGPVTVSILMRNVWRAYRKQHERIKGGVS